MNALSELLEQLGVERGAVLYVHTSFSRMRHLELDADEVIDTLFDVVGLTGTVVMPSFAWNLDPNARPWKGYRDYFELRPVFNVSKTVANIGWIPERFRHIDGVSRSASYWWSIAAKGAIAGELTDRQEAVSDAFGAGSSFALLHDADVTILGLGVSLNTTSLAPLVDAELGPTHERTVFTEQPEAGTIVTAYGETVETATRTLLPHTVRTIKPSRVIELSDNLRGRVRRADQGEAIQFAYPYRLYHPEALALGRAALAAALPAPWLATDAPASAVL
jgi:aminoglycoside N3'-acetyltransferase